RHILISPPGGSLPPGKAIRTPWHRGGAGIHQISALMPDRENSMSLVPRLLLLLVLLGLATTAPAADGPLPAAEIHPHEKLLIKVLEWQPGKGAYRDWTAFGGEYEVLGARTRSIPFAGEVFVERRSQTDPAAKFAASVLLHLAR